MKDLMFWGMIIISSLVIGMSIYILIVQAYLNKLLMDKFNDQKRECPLPVMAMESGHSLFSSIRCPLPGLIFSYFFFFFTPASSRLPTACASTKTALPKNTNMSPRLNTTFLRDFHSMVK